MVTPRLIDHLVLPVSTLEVARHRLSALGFVVAADARHPFGTENACVFFADGTYLEPLAIASRESCMAAVAGRNMFIARDQAFRFRVGQDGFSALVLKSADAAADDGQFHGEAVSGGPMLSFSRPVRSAAGVESTASFHLAFAADLRAPDFFFFSCERVNAAAFPPAPPHLNGVTGLKSVILSEQYPSDFQYLLETVLRQRDVRAHSFGLDIACANATLSVLTAQGIKAHYGVDSGRHGRGLYGEGLVFLVSSLEATEKCLVDSAIPFIRQAHRIIVLPEAGQGAFFAFEE